MATGPIRVRISPLQQRLPIVDDARRPTADFVRSINNAFKQQEEATNEIIGVLERLGLVETQASDLEAQTAALEAQQQAQASATSLQNSGVVNETGPIEADMAGAVTIADHTRVYGDPALNPSVPVDGSIVATGQAAGTEVFIYYSDPSRAGGAVTYLFSLSNDALVQSGDNHGVGQVVVPAALTETGTYVRPR